MSMMVDVHSLTANGNTSKHRENQRQHFDKEAAPATDLWTDGLICAFEYIRGSRRIGRLRYGHPRSRSRDRRAQPSSQGSDDHSSKIVTGNDIFVPSPLIDISASLPTLGLGEVPTSEDGKNLNDHISGQAEDSHWVAIGWARLQELVHMVHVDSEWDSHCLEFTNEEEDLTVADVAAPYWERPAGPTWWCHVSPEHPYVNQWLSQAQWLHPAVSIALRDETRLISERMKYLFYEVPVRVAGGLLFELLGQSAREPQSDEDDVPIVLRSWQAQNFLITAMHVKGTPSNLNVLGITEVQELLIASGSGAPKSVHEVIAHLASRLSRWDDRLFRKTIFGAADEVELKFVHRRNNEDLNLLCLILNQEIRRLSVQVIRVKWSLHAREEIIFELLQHLKGSAARGLLEGIKKSTRQMIEEQEAVRSRIFTIQDVMQSNVRAWLQDRSLRVTHNLAVIGGCGLILSIITGLFGINVDGIPGSERSPYAFALFSIILFILGFILIGVGMLYLGLKRPITEEKVAVRRLELDELVEKFQKDAEQHAMVTQAHPTQNLPLNIRDMFNGVDYIVAYE